MTKPARISYWTMLGILLLVGWLHLGTPLLAAMLSYFVLQKLQWSRHKWVAVFLFALLVIGTGYGLARFTRKAVVAVPTVADKAIPSIIDYAEKHGVELPFTDWESLKVVAMDAARGKAQILGGLANRASRELVLLILGIVVAVSLFLNNKLDLDQGTHPIRNNLYSMAAEEIVTRFCLFFKSFTTVMGAQILISAINTTHTAIFVISAGLPHGAVMVGVTFLCGLVPVVGNLISNAIITAIAFTVSPRMALVALGFLIVVHKLEYFLNSKIVGDRIRNPVWLTLLGLILGEKLMGIPGMILAPVVLNYIKVEATKVEMKTEPAAESP
ncbi:MAG: hypothetical protein QOF48_1061 [Verrucomicrobiota bacterium]